MCSDDLGKNLLSPDYNIQWNELLRQLVRFILGEKASVPTWDGVQMAVIKSQGSLLGEVASVEDDTAENGERSEAVHYRHHINSSPWIFTTSVESIRKGDLICALDGGIKGLGR